MFNAFLVGRLTADPESKVTKTSNVQYTAFNLAVNQGKDAQGQDKTAFINCSVYGKMGETVMQYLSKGKRVALTVNINDIGAYTTQNGNVKASINARVDSLDIIDWPEKNQAAPNQQHPQTAPQQQAQYGLPPQQAAYAPPQGQYAPQPTAPPQYQTQNQPPQQPPYPPQQGYPQQLPQGYPQQQQQTTTAPWTNSPLG